MQFENIKYLYILGAIPLVLIFFFIAVQWRKNAIKELGDQHLVYELMPRFSMVRKFWKLLFLLLALTSFVIALANLRMGSKREKVQREGSEVMICFDVSTSMLAEDLKPDRLTRAKILVSQLIDKLASNKIGLIVFAGRSYVQVPLTIDSRAVLMYLNIIDTKMVPTQGTAIGNAIETSLIAFENGGENKSVVKKNRAIIIISDGESHDEDALEMAAKAAEKNIKIITIGVGSTQGAPIPVRKGLNSTDFKKDSDGNIVLTKLNAQMMQQLSAAGNGFYMNIEQGKNVIQKISDEIAKLEKEKGEDYEYTAYQNHFQLFLALGLFFLAAEFFMSDKKLLFFSRFKLFNLPNGNTAEYDK